MVRPPPGPRRFRTILRNVLPWLVAALALAWVFHKVNFADLKSALARAPLATYLIASAVLLFLNCAADSLAMFFTFGWFGCRVAYRELFIVRAATYILAVVQYYVGQAAIVGFLHNRKGVPVWRASGFILFISGINMGVLVLLATAGLVSGEAPVKWLKWVPPGVGAGVVLYAILLILKPKRLAAMSLFAPLFEMGLMGHVKATLVRMPHVIVLIIWHTLALRWFGVDVPVLTALVYLPAVFFVAALPVSVQGLGLSQAAAVYFFAPYALHGDPTPVLAYSLAMTSVSLVVQVGMGVGFLPAGKRLGMRPETEQDEDDDEKKKAGELAEVGEA